MIFSQSTYTSLKPHCDHHQGLPTVEKVHLYLYYYNNVCILLLCSTLCTRIHAQCNSGWHVAAFNNHKSLAYLEDAPHCLNYLCDRVHLYLL